MYAHLRPLRHTAQLCTRAFCTACVDDAHSVGVSCASPFLAAILIFPQNPCATYSFCTRSIRYLPCAIHHGFECLRITASNLFKCDFKRRIRTKQRVRVKLGPIWLVITPRTASDFSRVISSAKCSDGISRSRERVGCNGGEGGASLIDRKERLA